MNIPIIPSSPFHHHPIYIQTDDDCSFNKSASCLFLFVLRHTHIRDEVHNLSSSLQHLKHLNLSHTRILKCHSNTPSLSHTPPPATTSTPAVVAPATPSGPPSPAPAAQHRHPHPSSKLVSPIRASSSAAGEAALATSTSTPRRRPSPSMRN